MTLISAAFRLRETTFELGDNRLAAGATRGGEIITTTRGARLWRGTATLAPGRIEDMRAAEARLRALIRGGALIEVADPSRRTLTITGRTIHSAQPEPDVIRLSSAASLLVGDYLAFNYLGRRALHQIVATGLGSNRVRVVPDVRPGLAAGAAVELAVPACRAVIVPESLSGSGWTGDGVHRGLSFEWRQTLRIA